MDVCTRFCRCVVFEPTCANARWALMHHFLSVIWRLLSVICCHWTKIQNGQLSCLLSLDQSVGTCWASRGRQGTCFRKGRWAHANVKLHFFRCTVFTPYSPLTSYKCRIHCSLNTNIPTENTEHPTDFKTCRNGSMKSLGGLVLFSPHYELFCKLWLCILFFA